MISIPSVNTVAFPSLATIKETTNEMLDCWQQWSDETFSGKYRDAAKTLICVLVLIIFAIALRAYAIAKISLPITFSYWWAVAKQRFYVESGLWIEQLAYKLLPVIECLDDCWRELAQVAVVDRQILEYELSFASAAAMQ